MQTKPPHIIRLLWAERACPIVDGGVEWACPLLLDEPDLCSVVDSVAVKHATLQVPQGLRQGRNHWVATLKETSTNRMLSILNRSLKLYCIWECNYCSVLVLNAPSVNILSV